MSCDVDNCRSCKASGECDSCQLGFTTYLNEDPVICVPCVDNCNQCDLKMDEDTLEVFSIC